MAVILLQSDNRKVGMPTVQFFYKPKPIGIWKITCNTLLSIRTEKANKRALDAHSAIHLRPILILRDTAINTQICFFTNVGLGLFDYSVIIADKQDI